LEATEARGEGSMTFDELVQQIEALRSDRPADPTTMTARATFHSLCWPPFITPMHIDAVLRGIATATAFDNTASLHLPNRRRSAEYRAALRAEHTAQCNLLRCIFGNPFRPVFFSPAWRSETAVALATAIYAERAFDRLPILADALEEAGCDHADSLAHCRGSGPHARGCWVVDEVLGKS
jgi:hypothetical protein